MAGRSDTEAMAGFVSNLGVESFPHLIDEDGSIWADLGVRSQPAFAFVNDDGTIEVQNRTLSSEELSAKLEELKAG